MSQKVTASGVVVLVVLVMVMLSLRTGEAGTQPHTIEGDFTVEFTYRDIHTSRGVITISRVNRIEIHENYVVVIDADDDGWLAPFHGFQYFDWTKYRYPGWRLSGGAALAYPGLWSVTPLA